jgi:hypothetical protein
MPSATYFCNDTKVGKKSPLKCRGGCTAQIPFGDVKGGGVAYEMISQYGVLCKWEWCAVLDGFVSISLLMKCYFWVFNFKMRAVRMSSWGERTF